MNCFNLKLAKIIYICAAIKWWRWKNKEEQGEASAGILKVATASVAVTQIQGRKKLDYWDHMSIFSQTA